MVAFRTPKDTNSTAPMQREGIQGRVSYFMMAEVIMKGSIGKTPKSRNAKKVANPHLIALSGSPTK